MVGSWIGAGSYLTFGLWSSVNFEDEASEHYCDKTAYVFTFVLHILSIVGSILLGCILCLIISGCSPKSGFKQVSDSDQDQAEQGGKPT